jgi:hypothetical protein
MSIGDTLDRLPRDEKVFHNHLPEKASVSAHGLGRAALLLAS